MRYIIYCPYKENVLTKTLYAYIKIKQNSAAYVKYVCTCVPFNLEKLFFMLRFLLFHVCVYMAVPWKSIERPLICKCSRSASGTESCSTEGVWESLAAHANLHCQSSSERQLCRAETATKAGRQHLPLCSTTHRSNILNWKPEMLFLVLCSK